MTMDYPYKIECLLRKYLGASERGEYYGIDADSGHYSEGIWKMSWATLTAIQLENPQKKDMIHVFLDENYNLVTNNKHMSDWDQTLMDNFYEDLKELLEV